MKGTSPSKSIQNAVNTAWGAQQKVTTDPKQALNQAHNKQTVPVSGTK